LTAIARRFGISPSRVGQILRVALAEAAHDPPGPPVSPRRCGRARHPSLPVLEGAS
jgi:hypothetical protein